MTNSATFRRAIGFPSAKVGLVVRVLPPHFCGDSSIYMSESKSPSLTSSEGPTSKGSGGKPQVRVSQQDWVASSPNLCFWEGLMVGHSLPSLPLLPTAGSGTWPRYKIASTVAAFWSYYECVCSDVWSQRVVGEMWAQKRKLCQVSHSSC